MSRKLAAKFVMEQEFAELVKNWIPEANVERVSPLTPDASTRRYFRLTLSGAPRRTAALMVFDALGSPEAGGATEIAADVAVVELTEFFLNSKVAVPEVYFADLRGHKLLIEDLGERHLADNWGKSSSELRELYRKAIEEIAKIQNVPSSDALPFKRSMSKETYLSEMSEFLDYTLDGKDDSGVVSASFDYIASKLDSFPKVLTHRDFHSWNLLVEAKDRIRVIDFQDALLATRAYDLVSLLNDRDTDAALGPELHSLLLKDAAEILGEEVLGEYDLVALQRDLKVAGRFEKLASERGLETYRKWIPGTLTRIKDTLSRVEELTEFRDLINGTL